MGQTIRSRIIAVASGGGHWEQLMLVAEAFRDEDVFYITTKHELLKQAGISNGAVVADCNRDRPLLVIATIARCAKLMLKNRPDVVVSTGAAPGLICLAIGRIIGCETIWIDSFANVEKLSMSGKLARYFARNWLTQWEHLSSPRGPQYFGQLL
jgi:UDP-N-acetylglucosamine:LPS N-acetylglucosamine transferase